MMAWPLLVCFGLTALVALAMLAGWLGGLGKGGPNRNLCPGCGQQRSVIRTLSQGYVGLLACANARDGAAQAAQCEFQLTEEHQQYSTARLALSQEAGRALAALPEDAAQSVVGRIRLFGRPPTTRGEAEAAILAASR